MIKKYVNENLLLGIHESALRELLLYCEFDDINFSFQASFLDLAFPIGSCMPRAVIYLASQKIPGMEVGDTVPS